MNINDIKNVYFVGAGGIGMSAVARYFLHCGMNVAGYDRTETELTRKLVEEGMSVHYTDDLSLIPEVFKDKQHTLVVYTPAIPNEHSELSFFRNEGFEIMKRAQVLGLLTKSNKALCVAGTHGKTTTTSMCAHILHQSHVDCNAFLGGITKNYDTNYILSKDSEYVVVEADEFDRSFHHLTPWVTVITSTDPDHLDIYGTKEAYLESFAHYTSLIRKGGALIIHESLEMQPRLSDGVKCYTYNREHGDFHAENIRIGNGQIVFDYVSPFGNVQDVKLGQPIPVNIENGIAAMAMAQMAGCSAEELRNGMATFSGVKRRFDFHLSDEKHVFLCDYAHHPKEISSCAESLKQVFHNRKITALFQPHLYTRTRDFYKDFAESLSKFDEVVLTEIYPARELPIEGVTSELIYSNLSEGVEKHMIRKDEVIEFLNNHNTDVLVLLGAGDLESYASEITELLKHR